MQTVIDIEQVKTRDGSICLYAKSGVSLGKAGRPVLLMIHGALRNSEVLFDWIPLCDPDFDVVCVDLPGHGRSPTILDVTIDRFAENIGDVVTTVLSTRRVVVVGESLGGLVALAMGGGAIPSINGIVAADPPMTMAKLWHVRAALSSAIASDPTNKFLQALALNIFGVGSDGAVHERIYYHLIDQARKPILVLTGDVPLLPPRNINAVPCLVDDVDRYVMDRLAANNVCFEVVSGCGHVLLVDAKERCRNVIARFCESALLSRAIGSPSR